ncbi:hypothetical protein BC826DRAFT_1016995 [Russula brevipes]|nr:hypothetical protein BC826DRAFT_1016995 [Russula brevipes]
MLKIPMSLNIQEIQRVTRRADYLRHAGGRADWRIVSPFPPPQRVPDGFVDLMPVISSNPYPTTSWEERPASPSKGVWSTRPEQSDVVQPIECLELTGPRPGYGASLTSQPPDLSLPPPYEYVQSEPPPDFPRASPPPFSKKGVPLDGPVSHPQPLPPMTPQVPVAGKYMDMHTAQLQSFGEDQGKGIRAPGFRMDIKSPPSRLISGNTGRGRKKQNTKQRPAFSTSSLSPRYFDSTIRCGFCRVSVSHETDEFFNGFCNRVHMRNAIRAGLRQECVRCRRWACYVGEALCGGVVCKHP